MMFFKKDKRQLQTADIALYQQLCERASAVLGRHGKPVEAYHDHQFSRLRSHHSPFEVITVLQNWVEVLEQAEAAKESLTDDKTLIWRMLKKLDLIPTSDMLGHLHDEDTIEIYTTDNWQIFRNLNFFDYLDATVDEISTIVWSRDSKRKVGITIEALKIVFLMKTKQLKKTLIAKVPTHAAHLNLSGKKQAVEIQIKIVAPLFRNRQVEAYLVTNKSRKII